MSTKSASKSKPTTIKKIEKDFGLVLPGQGTQETTISVTQDRVSLNKYKLDGRVGIHPHAEWFVHTQIPIDVSKVKEPISGLKEEGPQNDPNRRQEAADWLAEYNAKKAADEADKKRKADEKTAKAVKKAADEAEKKRKADEKTAKAVKKAADEAEKKRKADEKTAKAAKKAELVRKMAELMGEYEAVLKIEGQIKQTVEVRVKINAKGRITLVSHAALYHGE